jgi:5-methylcytosine-specific restriction endonuclease McrA
MKTAEQLARYAANRKAKGYADAIAAGRVPGLIGTPVRSSVEQKREKARLKVARRMADPEKRAKHYAAKNAARRTKWAAKAAGEGKVVRKWRYTKEERKAADKATHKRFREAHLEYRREYERKWKEKLRSTPEGRKYLQELAVVHGAKRRAQKRGCNGTHTVEDIKQLWFAQKGQCAWCDLPMEEKNYHVDHWKPLSKGGSNDKSNLKLLHPRCNLMKHTKLPSELNMRSI